VQSAAVQAYLSDAFLDRVKAAYRRALAATSPTEGQWAGHNKRRADVHRALLDEDNKALRTVFVDPTTTDLYYGVDRLARSAVRLNETDDFVFEALRDARAQCAAYQIKRIQELVPTARAVVEIGPGMGRAAYYGHLAGLDYTTIDLPLGIAAQACFLGRALGPDALWLAGEDHIPQDGRIKLLYSVPERHFDIALNVDSITEMPAAVALDYFRWMAAHAAVFLSINHDLNEFSVANLAAGAKVWVRRPCPVWHNYIEEVFLMKPARTPRLLNLARLKASVAIRRYTRGVMRRLPRFAPRC